MNNPQNTVQSDPKSNLQAGGSLATGDLTEEQNQYAAVLGAALAEQWSAVVVHASERDDLENDAVAAVE